jgi:hypothetical protein
MRATTRRGFLSGAAAAAAACAGACGPNQPSTNQSAGGSGPNPPPCAPVTAAPADQRVATDYLRLPRFLDPALDGKPSSTLLLYGLVCADFGVDKELLLPNTTGLTGQAVHQHRARLWLRKDDVDAGSATEDLTVTDHAEQFSFWDIAKHIVSIEALDSANTPLASPSPSLAWRNSEEHPWHDEKYVRCLKTITNKAMIPASSRNNMGLVTARVTMGKGNVVAVPPFTERGRNIVWKVTKFDATTMEQATTDAMVWQREYAPTVAKYKITLQPMGGGTPRVINVKHSAQSMVGVVTHAMTGSMPDPHKLTDTRSFAQLLVTGTVAGHPTPAAHRNHSTDVSLSGSDGHCECACA